MTANKIETFDAALNPCPFCGGDDLEIINTHTASFWVECVDCNARVPGGYVKGPRRDDRFHYDACPDGSRFDATYDELHPEYQKAFRSAVLAWNTRASTPEARISGQAPEAPGMSPYPAGVVVGACVCGSWPGGECLKCTVLPAKIDGDEREVFEREIVRHMQWIAREPSPFHRHNGEYMGPIECAWDGWKARATLSVNHSEDKRDAHPQEKGGEMKYEQMKRNDTELSLLCAAGRIVSFVRKEFPELSVKAQIEVMGLAAQEASARSKSDDIRALAIRRGSPGMAYPADGLFTEMEARDDRMLSIAFAVEHPSLRSGCRKTRGVPAFLKSCLRRVCRTVSSVFRALGVFERRRRERP